MSVENIHLHTSWVERERGIQTVMNLCMAFGTCDLTLGELLNLSEPHLKKKKKEENAHLEP